MNWKVFITVSISSAIICFPQNIIGCGGETDPYDYYTSFFHNNLPDAKGYKPFYYVGYNFLYDENEPTSVPAQLSEEWAGYCGQPVAAKDAYRFVNKYALKDLNSLYFNIEKNQPLKIPDSVKRNSMTDYFMQKKDLEGLGYIMYAKQVEPFVLGSADYWEAPNRDSVKMAKLIRNGQQLGAVAKKDFFKLKYAYQVLRLAHYSGRYKEVIQWYDDLNVASNSSSPLMSNLCLALKAGALFKTGSATTAAYLFSKVFAAGTEKRISNYLGFVWSINRKDGRESYLSLCKNNKEKADMLGMFAMSSDQFELDAMKEIYDIYPSSEMLEVLAVREINKLEEKYLTPKINKQPGGRNFFTSWYLNTDSATSSESNVKEFASFYHKMAQSGKTSNSGLFETAAAYTAYVADDLSSAKKYIDAANKMNLTQKAKDQLMLTSILVTISGKDKIDRSFEDQLLPGVQWLRQKAVDEKPEKASYWEINQWADFYRNLMIEVLAKRYHQQGDLQKELLCVGSANTVNESYEYPSAVNFMRAKFLSTDVENLFSLMDRKDLGRFETYLITNNSLKRSDVIDFAGTAYLRDYNYIKAIEWFNKSADKKSLAINTNPFIDLLYDQEERLPIEAKFSTNKLAFAQEMQRLLTQAQSDKASAGKNYYKYALGLYNMTYYGHAWRLVEYGRSGSDGYYIPDQATAFQKEYYGAYSALEYFEKAMNASTDANFKARCLFMMAKCNQKQLHQPKYDDYKGDNYYEKMEADEKTYFQRFKNSKYFPQLVKQYSNTPFYKEAYNSCSYLRDFVKKK